MSCFERPEFLIPFILGILYLGGHLIARGGGWSMLAGFYRASGSFLGECWRFQSAQMRWRMGYNNCLTVGSSPEGLYLSMLFLFRAGHPPLFIPWTEISIHSGAGFLSSSVEFRFRQAPTIPFRVSERLSRKIADAARTGWPGREPSVEEGRKDSTPQGF